jgi:hypothetical protein
LVWLAGKRDDGAQDRPTRSRTGDLHDPARTAGIDLNKPRIRAAMAAAVALALGPHGFTAAEFAAGARQMTRSDSYTTRQAAYDLRKLRGKDLLIKPGRSRRYRVPAPARPAPSPRSSHSATTSSRPSWPAVPDQGASQPTGPASTPATRTSASACKPPSTTSGISTLPVAA